MDSNGCNCLSDPLPSHSHNYTPMLVHRGMRTRTRFLHGIGITVLRFIFLSVPMLHCAFSVNALDTHISSSYPMGAVVVNASLGRGWSYSVHPTTLTSSQRFLQLDSSTGVVHWKGGVRCSHLKENPIKLNIVSRTWQWPQSQSFCNYTIIPYLVFVHDCLPLERSTNFKDNNVHEFAIGLNYTLSECIPPLTSLVNLTKFFPHTLHKCLFDVYFSGSSLPTILVHKNLQILTATQMCFLSQSVEINFFMSVLCDSSHMFQVPFRLLLLARPITYQPQIYKRLRRAANNKPQFSSMQYVVNVTEEQPPGIQVAIITATDTDREGAGTLTYSMVSNRDERSQNMFAMNPFTAVINTTQKLDRELIRNHFFVIIATDHGVPPQTASTFLTINVQDVNDNAPVFDQQTYKVNLTENQSSYFPVLTVQATDRDADNNAEIRYSILNPDDPNDAFMINPSTGTISTTKEIDREQCDHYELLIMAMDQGDASQQKSSSATVEITVTDENDNSPSFPQTLYKINIPEDQEVSSTVPIFQVTATDADIGKNSEIKYQLSGSSRQKFSIEATTGKIYLVQPLDYDQPSMRDYSLLIRAEDQGTPSRLGTATVLVQVVDVNDNSPKFLSQYDGISLTENCDLGKSVVQVQASDADSGQNSMITYSILSSNQTLPFIIDSLSGWITTNGSIDRERQALYSFVVIALDNGIPPRSATANVVIIVRDVNDNAPIFTSGFYQAAVSEDAEIGTTVLRVTAVDADEGDNSRVQYDIEDGNTGDVFQIISNQNEGVITVKKALDARQQFMYSLSVIATDSGGRRDTAQVFINVTDTNRNAPEFQGTPYYFAVNENISVGTVVFRVKAVDKDRGENARITYSMDTGVKAFAIDPNTGNISTRVPLDRETVPAYTLRVTATDNGIPQWTVTADIDVTINDVNDNKPEFTEIIYSGNVVENAVPGTRVIQLTAIDRDKDLNGQVFYTFEGGNDGNGDFSIDSASGLIRVKKELDRERTPNYELVALAVDRGLPPRSSSAIVRIKVDDVNDNHPQFESDELNVWIPENSPIGSTVARITATDPDEGINALVEYTFDGGQDVDSFQLSGRKGDPAIITTLIPLDYESDKKQYEIILKASSGTQFSTAKVLINVRDVNDNVPRLKDFYIIYNNFGGSFPTVPIGRIPAFDPDVSDQEILVYQILSGNEANLLHLNNSTGQITLDSRLNSDVPRNGTFQVSVSDGKNMVKATCSLYVRLVTSEMLRDSVTIRLNQMTETAFLSSLLKFFTDALASIFHTIPANIFVINIENDIDVAPAQILNVSVSVRQSSTSVQGLTKDIFYSPEYLREYIYLYRSLLANLSALQILPFDDNLCLQEPCANFAECLSTVRQGKAMPFIASETVLFRPIHPDNGYKCECPPGFAGMGLPTNCDTEVDLCYSMPCHNGGTCIPHESGYTCNCANGFEGTICEVNMTANYDAITCPKEFCHAPSICVPSNLGGFHCDACSAGKNYDSFCRLTTRSFKKGSYLTFPTLKKRNRFTIKLKFVTQERNGLLVYNGRFNEEHDFIGLEIVDSQVTFSFSLGDNKTSVSTYIQGGVNTGEWFEVTLHYHEQVATLTVGKDCDTYISLLYGNMLKNYSCSARVTRVLPDECNNPVKSCHRLLDLTGPLQIGGLPWAPSMGQVTEKDFVGCIGDIFIDNTLLDLSSPVVDVLTEVGCPQKDSHCQSSPCTLGGKCQEGWNTFICECPEKAGGKDCSQVIDGTRQLHGSGYLLYDIFSQTNVLYPWYNGIAFRTRATSGTLMQIILDAGQATLQVKNGLIGYTFEDSILQIDSAEVNDGRWHYVEVRWYQDHIDLLLDYSQRQNSISTAASVSGRNIQVVYVGGKKEGNGAMTDGFVGCVKDIRVGNNPNAILTRPRETNVVNGCSSQEVCTPNPCGQGTCQDLWEDYKCVCPPGKIGPQCEDICSNFNPCQNWAECQHPASGEDSYSCACGIRQTGRYCENMVPVECPAAWWGDTVCGPCDCDLSRGFESNCNKKNGSCSCKELHYQPPAEGQCFPCDCYLLASKGPACDIYTGRCQCREGVIGRRCDQCDSIFAGIDPINGTCKVMSYDACPRNYASGIWWDPVAFGETAVQDCPVGASGTAKRMCTKHSSWLESDLFNCISPKFVQLAGQLADFQNGMITPYSADLAIEQLKSAANTTYPLYGGDIIMTLNFTKAVLNYENQQTGLGLISQQYRDFVQQLVITLSNITKSDTSKYWPKINDVFNGTTSLLHLLENYLIKIATIMPQAQSIPFEAVSDGIVLGADWMLVQNSSIPTLPKYDNNINIGSAQDYASILLPPSLFAGFNTNGSELKSYFGYAVYHTMGSLVKMDADETIRRTNLPLIINGPMFTFVIQNEGKLLSGQLREAVYVKLKLRAPGNTSNLQCATWTINQNGQGLWSGKYCSLSDTDCRVRSDSQDCQETYITCKCYHLSTFGIIIDHEDAMALRTAAVQVEVLSYILVGFSLILLLLVFFILISFKLLQSNWNSIHINLVFVIFITELTFVIGINHTSDVFCHLVAISLHYFYMAAFAWLYVENLHIYRMLTEKHTINYGSMKFYYLLGYVIPGIIVGLAVGLYTDGYGSDSFCWLETSEMLIWSFAGPIVFAVVVTVITFVFAVKTTRREKTHVSDIKSIRIGLITAIVLLQLLSMSWVLGLLSVNFRLVALGYVYAVVLFFQGAFLFLMYILLCKKVRLCLKSAWYKLQGKKLDLESNISGARSSVTSRSALAYRNDSSTECGLKINVGISTTSTTSQSSKSTGRYGSSRFKGDEFGKSTSSSTSGHVPSNSSTLPKTGMVPYGYDFSTVDRMVPEEEYPTESIPKASGNDSDSDSDASADRNSLELASSHSSDEDDDFQIGPPWDQHIPKSKTVEQAQEQLEKHRKEKERERLGNNNRDQEWADCNQMEIGVDQQPVSRLHVSSIPPDVTLTATTHRTGRKVTIIPPVRSDSVQNNYTSSSNVASETTDHIQVQLFTHNGSLSSDSESCDETNI